MFNSIVLGRARDPAFTKEVERRSGQDVSTCYQCGNCTAGCPAGFVYDKQVNQIMRMLQLGLKEQILASNSIWLCLGCSMCTLRCPNNIDVAGIMETLRHIGRHEGRVTVPNVEKFWFSFLDTVRTFGRTYEVGTMALYMLRSLKLTTDVDLAPAALRKRKLSMMPAVPSSQAAAATGRIMKRYRERAEREGVRP